jgi:hypothetical protein
MAQTSTITSINRDFNLFPNIVGIVTSANLATITTPGYLIDEDANIQALNNGEFEWEVEDMVEIYYADNQLGWFQRDALNSTFIELTFVADGSIDFPQLNPEVSQQAIVPITSAQIQGMYATPILLIPAKGLNTLIDIQEIIWVIPFQSAAYAAGGTIKAQYGNTASGAGPAASGSMLSSVLIGVTDSACLGMAGTETVLNAPQTACINGSVYLSNLTGPFTTGDSDATLYIRYRVINIAIP